MGKFGFGFEAEYGDALAMTHSVCLLLATPFLLESHRSLQGYLI